MQVHAAAAGDVGDVFVCVRVCVCVCVCVCVRVSDNLYARLGSAAQERIFLRAAQRASLRNTAAGIP
jgi:hypothetical protein